MYLRRLGAALEAATPSLSSRSLMVEASSEGDAQMEMDALGCDGQWVSWAQVRALGPRCDGDRALGWPMVAGMGLSWSPGPFVLMKGLMSIPLIKVAHVLAH